MVSRVTHQVPAVYPTPWQVDGEERLLKASKMIMSRVPFNLCLGLGLNEEPRLRPSLAT